MKELEVVRTEEDIVVRCSGNLLRFVKAGAKFASLPEDFSPDTDEVLIVKKNARRVFVEYGIAGCKWLHCQLPTFSHNRKSEWNSPDQYLLDTPGHFDEIGQYNVGEFVAVRTHRPPEPQKPVANSAGDLTCAEGTWLFPVIQIDPSGSSLQQVIEESTTIGTGVNGLAVGWRRTITTKKRIDPSAQ